MSTARHVYVIGGQNGPQKIGVSADPAQRLQTVQSHSPGTALLHHQVQPDGDARLVERVAHQLLHAKRLHGEWFDVKIEEAIAAIGQAIDLVEAGDLSILEPPAVVRTSRKAVLINIKVAEETAIALARKAVADGQTQKQIIVRALQSLGLPVDPLDLEDRSPRRRAAA